MPLPLIIDSFAGGGGASTGIEMALGRSPDYAINHSAKALALHEANHPDTIHLDSNIWDVEPTSVTKGRSVGLLWASPDCKHFSKAKGGAPRDRNIRDLAWVIVDWAEKVKPDVILMENVEEFKTWGPVGEDGQPLKWAAGQTFDLWTKRLKKAGYKLKWGELRACDYGDPTIRKRFFLIARRDGRPIVWPKPTHGDPKSKEVLSGKLKPWRTAAECIDWSLPCPSIFDTSTEIKEKHGLRAIRPLAKNTLARVARGMQRYVLNADDPFVVELPDGQRATPSVQRFNTGATGQDFQAPLATITANSWIKKPGGAAPLGIVWPHLMSLKGTARRSCDVTKPHATVLAGGGHSALIAPHVMTMRNAQKPYNGADEPVHTITAGGAGLTVVAPVLTYAQQGGRNRDVAAPHHTITASTKDQNAMIAPMLVQSGYGERKGQAPRSLDVSAPLGTVVAGGIKHAAVAPFLAQHNKARSGFNPGRNLDAPISTVTATGSQQGLVAPLVVRHFGQSTGHAINSPLGTVTAGGGGKSGLVAPWFAKYYGTGDGARCSDPMHTVTVKDRMGHMQAELAAPTFSPEHEARAREVAQFLRSQGVWDGGEFVTVTIKGQEFVVVDIGMRMLTPRELFSAQGFPPDYVIEGVWSLDTKSGAWSFHAFTKNVQVSCCGNSVCPGLARALAAANCGHLIAAGQPEVEAANS
ncbi:modification methylase NaeI [Phaeobacter gallaeciensis]|uniref:DNA (cytosine-5-)-methyltransferase n=2 Tax=Phaeobacter gallaeciensis TaxID=60890 RepID=A0AAC9Z8R2_9RHOB|nr:DNA cytosine methyltransferase [Phaeobacter gallaeciensis]ATE92767.1 modification methylase NaeI [Phaeobacter gallaeciensis]ATE97411.1 modification methylase NaeI [Phaeobacter gallaeciensis]ATF01432.1 modification methylase NaeI [Phaeobacter gallaeciensis]ATF05812.1 modification methylase NaeI [Phaeobacter gallaeciensis]